MTTKKHAGGRPRKTLKDFNLPNDWKETIYNMSAKGCSEVEIRAHFLMAGGSFCQSTWDILKKRDEEFSLTINKAKILCQAWWERMGRENVDAEHFQTGLWYANMKNRFGWRDRHDVVNDTTVSVALKPADIKKMSAAELAKHIQSDLHA